MSAGPHHFEQAELSLEAALDPDASDEQIANHYSAALIHALLAGAAAAALPARTKGGADWLRVLK